MDTVAQAVIQFLDFGRTAEKGRIFAIATNRHRCDLLRNIGGTDWANTGRPDGIKMRWSWEHGFLRE
jgi:hypothetical protein